jgi:adenylate cyclase
MADLGPTARARLEELRSSGASRPIVDFIERTVVEGSDFDCWKMNPFRVAAQAGVDRMEAVRSFLFATRIGLTDLNWDIHCPSCLGQPAYHRHLMQLSRRAHCRVCELEWDLDFEEQVEATFTVNPDVRPLDPTQFEEVSWPEAAPRYLKRLERDGRKPIAGIALERGTTVEAEVMLLPGDYEYQAPGHPDLGGLLTVAGEPTTEMQQVSLAVAVDGQVTPPDVELRPGSVRIRVASDYPKPNWGLRIAPRVDRCSWVADWVSAAYVTGLQDFRDLFSGEYLAPDLSFSVRSTTLMFTDIRGSTQMYERLGDASAYALVQEHFRLMTDVIRRFEGGVVKTIGDAVMASFPSTQKAVAAALEVHRAFAEAAAPLGDIAVKIGLHRGPAIAVTSNRALDFFGRTVNIAARVQGRAEAGEVLLSEAVWSDPGVRALLDERGIVPRMIDAELRGLSGRFQLAALRPPRS